MIAFVQASAASCTIPNRRERARVRSVATWCAPTRAVICCIVAHTILRVEHSSASVFRYLARACLAQLTALVWRTPWLGSRSGRAARAATMSTSAGTVLAAYWSNVRTNVIWGATAGPG
jgi:hypothetical protein